MGNGIVISSPALSSSVDESNTNHKINVVPSTTLLFPKKGVKLQYATDFIQLCGGREVLQGLTTSDVCEKYVKPMTASSQSSFVELLEKLDNPSVGMATVFISHAWKYEFLHVYDALLYHFREELDSVIIWFDMFSNNQHKATELDFDWWCNTFRSAIQQFGRTVMVLAPWNDPIPLTRAWCLWELYCTIATESKFEIAMSEEARKQFLKDICGDTIIEVDKMLATIKVSRSESFKPEVKENIKKVVRSTVGFHKLDSIVFEKMREWMIGTAEEELKNVEIENNENEYKYEIMNALGNLLRHQGSYDKVEEYYRKCYDGRMKMLGEDHADTLKSLHSLGLVYTHLGKFEKAEECYVNCLAGRLKLFGEKNIDSLRTINNLGNVYSSQRNYGKAEEYYLRSYEGRLAVFGDVHTETLEALNNLGSLYGNQGNFEKAAESYLKSYDGYVRTLGEDHPETLQSICNLGVVYKNQENYIKAEEYDLKSYEGFLRVYGEDHPQTLMSMNNLGSLYFTQGKYEKAEGYLIRAYEGYKNVFGVDHQRTIDSMFYLGIFYDKQGDAKKAEEYYVKACEGYKSLLGETHAQTSLAISSLVQFYQRQNSNSDEKEVKNDEKKHPVTEKSKGKGKKQTKH